MSAYFYRDSAGREIGPVEKEAMAKLQEAGILNNNTAVRSETSPGWELLRDVLPPLSAPQPPQAIAKKSLNWTRVGFLIAVGIFLIAWRFDHRYAVAAERFFRQQVEPLNKLVSFRVTEERWLSEPKSNFDQHELEFEAEIEFGKDSSMPGELPGEGLAVAGRCAKFSGRMLATKEWAAWHGDTNWYVDISEWRVVSSSDSRLSSALKSAEDTSMQNACISNLRIIDGAKGQWALENHKQNTDSPTAKELRPYVGRGSAGEFPVCPKGGTYTIGAVQETPTCSIPGHRLP